MSRCSVQKTGCASFTLLAALFPIPSLLDLAGADRRGGPRLCTAGLCATQQGESGTKLNVCYWLGQVEKTEIYVM